MVSGADTSLLEQELFDGHIQVMVGYIFNLNV